MKSTEVSRELGEHNNLSDVKTILTSLQKLYNISFSNLSQFGNYAEKYVKLFQEENNLLVSGKVNV